MRSSSIVLAVGLLAAPLALITAPREPAPSFSLVGEASAQAVLGRTADSVNGHKLEDAPMPSVGPAGIPAVDRFGGPGARTLDAGPSDGTPFSDAPSGTLSEGGSQTTEADRVITPQENTTTTPNLSR